MYLILNHAERIVDISEEARYVKRQENGVIVGALKTTSIGENTALSSGARKRTRTQSIRQTPTPFIPLSRPAISATAIRWQA